MPTGLGIAPIGVAPYGYGTPTAAPLPGGSVYRDEVTGEILTGRRIDHRTRQYVYDSYGRALGVRTAQQLVYLALTTTRGSAVVTTLGNRLRTIQDVGDNHQTLVESVIREALTDLVNRKIIEVRAVSVSQHSTTGTYIEVEWIDLTTGQIETTPLT